MKKEQILELLLNGLKRLEYRGYDSSGIAIDAVDGEVQKPEVFRAKVGDYWRLINQMRIRNILYRYPYWEEGNKN